jgi:predicted nucleic acid-binding protein
VLLSLAHADLYTARWTQEIEHEWASSLVKKYPDAADKIPRLVEHMREAIPDCLIVDYAPLIASIQLPDERDRHVLAAAIRGNADAIVSLNTKDFPASVLATFDIEIQTPDQFVLNQIMLNPPKALMAIKKCGNDGNDPACWPQTWSIYLKKGNCLRQLPICETCWT